MKIAFLWFCTLLCDLNSHNLSPFIGNAISVYILKLRQIRRMAGDAEKRKAHIEIANLHFTTFTFVIVATLS